MTDEEVTARRMALARATLAAQRNPADLAAAYAVERARAAYLHARTVHRVSSAIGDAPLNAEDRRRIAEALLNQ